MNKILKTGILILLIAAFSGNFAQNMPQVSKPEVKIKFIENEIPVEISNKIWEKVEPITIKTYWSAGIAPAGRQFNARLLWSKTALYVLFEANQVEPLVISERPDLSKKTLGLWNRDVCEIFLAPDMNEPRKYFEFEVAPTGEWIDVALNVTSGERKSNWEYKSGMETAVGSRKEKILMLIKIPWTAFGKIPKAGDVWLGNIFRCIGKDPNRGYLAWLPTMTKNPDFHVPGKFGKFIFQK